MAESWRCTDPPLLHVGEHRRTEETLFGKALSLLRGQPPGAGWGSLGGTLRMQPALRPEPGVWPRMGRGKSCRTEQRPREQGKCKCTGAVLQRPQGHAGMTSHEIISSTATGRWILKRSIYSWLFFFFFNCILILCTVSPRSRAAHEWLPAYSYTSHERAPTPYKRRQGWLCRRESLCRHVHVSPLTATDIFPHLIHTKIVAL